MHSDNDFCISVYSPGNLIAKTITINGNVALADERQLSELCNETMLSDESGEVPALPEVLATDTAMRYWAGLQACGFVDDDCRLLKTTTRKQAMYIADLFADALQLRSKWKLFEQFWGIRNLAQEKWEMQENGKMPNRYDEINKIFEE